MKIENNEEGLSFGGVSNFSFVLLFRLVDILSLCVFSLYRAIQWRSLKRRIIEIMATRVYHVWYLQCGMCEENIRCYGAPN